MSADEKLVTEREAVERERKAFMRGVARAGGVSNWNLAYWRAAEAQYYPLAKVTRPRVVRYGEASFKVIDGKVWSQPTKSHDWFCDTFTRWEYEFLKNPELLRVLAYLLANPTEEVDA